MSRNDWTGPLDGEAEDGLAWESFRAYRDLREGRSLGEVARFTGHSIKEIRRWSEKYNWPDRIRAYLRHQDEVDREELEAARAARNGIDELKMRIGYLAYKRGAEAIKGLRPTEVAARDALRLVDSGIGYLGEGGHGPDRHTRAYGDVLRKKLSAKDVEELIEALDGDPDD